MSNAMVGSIFAKIIDDTIEINSVVFEEEGVDKALLQEIKKRWQQNLSERKLAQFPWDPPPPPPPPQTPTPSSTLTSNTPPRAPSHASPHVPSNNPHNKQNGASSGPYIKPEPSAQNELRNIPPNMGNYGSINESAYSRASQQLQEKFGPAAASQVNALQQRAAMASQNSQAPRPQAPGSMTAEQNRILAYQRQQQANSLRVAQMQASRAAQQQPQSQQPSIKTDQTDGAPDWNELVVERRSVPTEPVDRALRDVLGQSGIMSDSGLLMPRSERKTHVPRASALSASNTTVSANRLARHDGGDEEDDDDDAAIKKQESDEDAINSDLDDSDEDAMAGDIDGEEAEGDMMLCTYDKVQRVKNKWKCTLKDGILHASGREFVFHKAQGEFEW